MIGETVLVDVECLRCEMVHDAWASEGPGGSLVVPDPELRCPTCYPRRTQVSVRERESLA